MVVRIRCILPPSGQLLVPPHLASPVIYELAQGGEQWLVVTVALPIWIYASVKADSPKKKKKKSSLIRALKLLTSPYCRFRSLWATKKKTLKGRLFKLKEVFSAYTFHMSLAAEKFVVFPCVADRCVPQQRVSPWVCWCSNELSYTQYIDYGFPKCPQSPCREILHRIVLFFYALCSKGLKYHKHSLFKNPFYLSPCNNLTLSLKQCVTTATFLHLTHLLLNPSKWLIIFPFIVKISWAIECGYVTFCRWLFISLKGPQRDQDWVTLYLFIALK